MPTLAMFCQASKEVPQQLFDAVGVLVDSRATNHHLFLHAWFIAKENFLFLTLAHMLAKMLLHVSGCMYV